MKRIGVGIIGARPGGGWAAATRVPALRALPFRDAVRLHRLVDRIASGASTAGAKMTADSEEASCVLQS